MTGAVLIIKSCWLLSYSYTVNCDALVLENASMLPQGVDGLLGIRYLQHFGIADFNYATNTLKLYPYDAKTEVGAFTLIGLRWLW